MSWPPARIVVIVSDPDLHARLFFQAHLATHYEVMYTANLQETHALLASIPPGAAHVILLLEIAQQWVQGDGIDFIRFVRAEPQIRQSVRAICCVTGRVTLRDKTNALQAGADDYLHKPIQGETLIGRLHIIASRLV